MSHFNFNNRDQGWSLFDDLKNVEKKLVEHVCPYIYQKYKPFGKAKKKKDCQTLLFRGVFNETNITMTR